MRVAGPPATALGELLRSMADDEFVIGFSDSEWTGIAPLLEEDVAISSLAQDEIGHAAALYGLLGALTGKDPDAIAYDREPAAYRHCRLLDHGRGDWAMTIARRYLYDTADGVRLAALVVSGDAGRAAVAVEGRWDGSMDDPDFGKRAFQVQMRQEGGRLAGTLTTWRGSIELRSPLREIAFDRGQLSFTADLQGAAFRFRGTLENNTVTGTIERASRAAVPFTLQFVE